MKRWRTGCWTTVLSELDAVNDWSRWEGVGQMQPPRIGAEVGRGTQTQKPRMPRSPDDMSDPEVDIEQGRLDNKELEKRSPKFKAMMDRLRKAAKAVGRNMKMLFVLA